MMKTITGEEAIRLLEYVVSIKGEDFSYDPTTPNELGVTCFYAREGGASCGVGRALSIAGVSVSTLEQMDNVPTLESPGTEISAEGVQKILREAGFFLTPQAIRVFTYFQEEQDHRTPYGACLREARQAL